MTGHHWFKRAPAVTGVLTGKPCDVAGPVVAPPVHAALARAALVTGLLACVACEVGDPPESVLLLNHRNAPLRVQVADGPELDCYTYDPDSLRSLTRSAFTDFRAWTVTPESWGYLGVGACGVVWLKVEDAFDGLITWNGPSHRPSRDAPISKALFPIAVTVEGLRDEFRVTVGEELEALPSPQVD